MCECHAAALGYYGRVHRSHRVARSVLSVAAAVDEVLPAAHSDPETVVYDRRAIAPNAQSDPMSL